MGGNREPGIREPGRPVPGPRSPRRSAHFAFPLHRFPFFRLAFQSSLSLTVTGVRRMGRRTGSGGGGQAFRWKDGAYEDLGTAPGFAYSSGMAINESGQVAGSVTSASTATAYCVRPERDSPIVCSHR